MAVLDFEKPILELEHKPTDLSMTAPQPPKSFCTTVKRTGRRRYFTLHAQ